MKFSIARRIPRRVNCVLPILTIRQTLSTILISAFQSTHRKLISQRVRPLRLHPVGRCLIKGLMTWMFKPYSDCSPRHTHRTGDINVVVGCFNNNSKTKHRVVFVVGSCNFKWIGTTLLDLSDGVDQF